MGNKVESIQRTNVATPLSQDLIALLQGQISGGTFGAGVGPLQREAGTAARQFVNSGGMPIQMDPVFEALRNQFQRGTTGGLRDIREQFGIAGARFGTGIGAGSAQFLGQREADIGAQLSQIALQDIQSRRQAQLGGIGLLNQIGVSSIAPAFGLAGQGVLPPQLVQKKGFLGQLGDVVSTASGIIGGINPIAGAVGGLAGGFLGGGGDSPVGGGGGGGGGPFGFSPTFSGQSIQPGGFQGIPFGF